MPGQGIDEVNDQNFDQEVRRASLPVVVDFWAPWCGPCKQLDPVLSKLAGKYAGRVKFVSLNVDENKVKANEYAVRSIPTLLFFKDGSVRNQIIGLQSEESIERALESLL